MVMDITSTDCHRGRRTSPVDQTTSTHNASGIRRHKKSDTLAACCLPMFSSNLCATFELELELISDKLCIRSFSAICEAKRRLYSLLYIQTDTSPHLRSANQHQLTVPRCRQITFGHQAFSVAGPMVWNSPSTEFRICLSVLMYLGALYKMILFARYYCIQPVPALEIWRPYAALTRRPLYL